MIFNGISLQYDPQKMSQMNPFVSEIWLLINWYPIEYILVFIL